MELLAFCVLYQSLTGPLSKPEVKSRRTGLLKNSALVAAMTELDGAREGVRAEGTRAKELRKHSSRSARSSLTDGEEGCNRRNEGIINRCSMLVGSSMDSREWGRYSNILKVSAGRVYSNRMVAWMHAIFVLVTEIVQILGLKRGWVFLRSGTYHVHIPNFDYNTRF